MGLGRSARPGHRTASEREAGAAEPAPEAFQVMDGHCAGPCTAMIVTVDAAAVGAAARSIALLAVHSVTAPIAPGGVATEAAHRRPFRHRRRRRQRVEAREGAGCIN